MPSFGNFLHTQFVLKIPQPSASFAAKTVIITGANGGLGTETAKHVIRLGAARVVFGCRSVARGTQAKRAIEALLACSPDIVDVWELDLESPASVKRFVDRANALPRLDVLINNAGIRAQAFQRVYGTERSVAVNVVGTFLLALQLLPKLRKTASAHGGVAHMTFVGSALYDAAKYPEGVSGDVFSSFEASRFHAQNQYNLSKLLQLYAVIQLSAALGQADPSRSQSVVVNSLDPCFCKTGLPGELKGVEKAVFGMVEGMLARPAEEGARLVVQAAAAGPETHGRYLRAGAVQEYHPVAQNAERATHVWDMLCKRLELLQPGILQNI